MNRTTSLLVAGTIAVGAAGLGTGIAIAAAQGPDSPQQVPTQQGPSGQQGQQGPSGVIQNPDLDRATSVALEQTGGGRVTGTEVGDHGPFYEIEVTLDDGTEVDLKLDTAFQVVAEDRDSPEPYDD